MGWRSLGKVKACGMAELGKGEAKAFACGSKA